MSGERGQDMEECVVLCCVVSVFLIRDRGRFGVPLCVGGLLACGSRIGKESTGLCVGSLFDHVVVAE
jgi:hypothetical protein